VEFALLILTIMIVVSAELLNTALEIVVDLASPTYHPLARAAKDVAASAVLICAILSVVLGLVLFLPHLLPLIFP
jgi:diacylglycerol kinase